MSRIIKNIIKITVVILGIFIILFLCIYHVHENDAIGKEIKNKGGVTFSVLLYGSEKLFPGRLDVYTVLYDKGTNVLKVLSVNTDVVVFKKKEKTISLKAQFNKNAKKDLSSAIQKFYLDLHEVLENTRETSFYINMSFEMLNAITGNNKELQSLIAKDSFENKDLESLNRYETIECVLNLMPYKILNIYKNHHFLDTNISRISFITSVLRFKTLKSMLMFCELPVKYTKTRVEPDKQNIKEFLDTMYYVNVSSQTKTSDILVDIKNASKKPRIAEKLTWVLRDNKFDVLDWSNFSTPYEKTLIKDYKGKFYQALKIAKILETNKVIVSYNNRAYVDVDVFLGRDCIICDNLDKRGEHAGKN
ncbi:hypothetical protein AGMMS50233_01290 [Endomicrobiia bacterium]|nr:hypothetical protein AGMMS50233_01290 [Endomicrobiia bacterium]